MRKAQMFGQNDALLTQAPALASNPANNINNIPLSGTQLEQGDTLTSEEIQKVLTSIMQSSSSNVANLRFDVEKMLSRSQNPNVQERLRQILHALTMNSDPKMRTVDPSTGKEDPTPADIAKKLSQEITQMNKDEKTNKDDSGKNAAQNNGGNSFSAPAMPQAMPAQTVAKSNVFNLREAQAKKKKTRGNPFRVLMGKVGKLLDHGLEKSTIVREIKKRINFDEDTIARAVDIVRDYNKSKRRDYRAKGNMDDKKEDKKKDGTKDKSSEKKSNAVYNGLRVSQAQGAREIDGNDIYTAKPDFEKRSTAELMARATWLLDLQGMGKDADSQVGASGELKSIRAALKLRGFDEKELSRTSKN